MKITAPTFFLKRPIKKPILPTQPLRPSVYKILLPPRLNDFVSGRGEKVKRAPCLEELSVMLSCWKENDFNEEKCHAEIKSFKNCYTQTLQQKEQMEQALKSGQVLQKSGRYPSAHVNKMLKRYPQPKQKYNLKF